MSGYITNLLEIKDKNLVFTTKDVDKILLRTYGCYQSLPEDIKNNDSKMLKEHMNVYKNVVDENIKIAISPLLSQF